MALWVICVHVVFTSTGWWSDGMLGRNSSAKGLGRSEEPPTWPARWAETELDGELLFGSHAGVTTCVCLSWASSRASGGPSPSSAGSVTEPSVSCCRPSTFPTCTVCGKPLPVGSWLHYRALHFRLGSILPARCPSMPRGQSRAPVPFCPHRDRQTVQKQQKVLSKTQWAPGSRLSQNKKT